MYLKPDIEFPVFCWGFAWQQRDIGHMALNILESVKQMVKYNPTILKPVLQWMWKGGDLELLTYLVDILRHATVTLSCPLSRWRVQLTGIAVVPF